MMKNHYTTAYDLYLIFIECIKHEEFVQVISAQAYDPQITGADGNPRSVEWEPTNFYATGEASRPESRHSCGRKDRYNKACRKLSDPSEQRFFRPAVYFCCNGGGIPKNCYIRI